MTCVTFCAPYARPPWRAKPPEHGRDPRADYESVAFFNPGETAGFPDDEAAWLVANGIAHLAAFTTDGGMTERTDV